LISTKDEIKQIEEDAGIVELAFKRFHEMQTEQEMDAQDFKAAKEDLRERLKELSGKLDQYLVKEYGIDLKKKKAFEDWRSSHQPFHWFVEFYGIMNRGGFDVIIGNPPYVEYRQIKDYNILRYKTEPCGNLYAYVLERCNSIIGFKGRTGMIVQLPIVCTDRMIPLQNECFEKNSNLWFANFDDRPARLFDDLEHIRASILLSVRGKKTTSRIYTTKYNRWYTETRNSLFEILKFIETQDFFYNGAIVKLGDTLGQSILNRLQNHSPLAKYKTSGTKHLVFFHNAPQYWVRATDFAPYFWNERDGQKLSTQIKKLCFNTSLDAKCVTAVLNSSLYYWWFILLSDCRHLNMREIDNFPISLDQFSNEIKVHLADIVPLLMKDFKLYSNRKECTYKTTGKVIYDEFFPKKSKEIVDKIDLLIGKHYGFKEEEIDFITNYDIKYRMGY